MMDPAQTLQAGPVTLCRWDRAWAEQLEQAIRASLPELRQFMPWATEQHGIADTRAYLEQSVAEWQARESWGYAIVNRHGEIVGSCSLMTRMGPGVLEIGYWVHSAHAGQGLASAAATALADAGLHVDGVDRVVIKHDCANPASGRVAAKAGFTQVDRITSPPQAPGETGSQLVWERRVQTSASRPDSFPAVTGSG